MAALLAPRLSSAADPSRAHGAPPCTDSPPASLAPALTPVTVATIEQAYGCLLAHYPSGRTLDDRVLLQGAMVGLVGYLVQQGLDQPAAVLPALAGDPHADWRAFGRTYLRVAARLPRDGRTQQALAQAAIAGLVASLHDDHTGFAIPQVVAGGGQIAVGPGRFGLGLRLSADASEPTWTRLPLFVVAVDDGSPAAHAGLRPGDIILAIDGLPPFVQGEADQAVLAQLAGRAAVRLRLRRPATARVMTIALTAAPYPAPFSSEAVRRRGCCRATWPTSGLRASSPTPAPPSWRRSTAWAWAPTCAAWCSTCAATAGLSKRPRRCWACSCIAPSSPTTRMGRGTAPRSGLTPACR